MLLRLSTLLLLIICQSSFASKTQYCNTDCAYEFNMFKKYAKKGSPLAEYMLGVMLLTGQGTEKSIEAGFRHIENAALDSEPSAQYQLGYFLLYGVYVEANIERAENFFKRAKKNNFFKANQHLKTINEIKTQRSNQQKLMDTTPVNIPISKQSDKPIIKMEVISVFADLSYSDIIYATEQQACKPMLRKVTCDPFVRSAFVPFFEIKELEERVHALYL